MNSYCDHRSWMPLAIGVPFRIIRYLQWLAIAIALSVRLASGFLIRLDSSQTAKQSLGPMKANTLSASRSLMPRPSTDTSNTFSLSVGSLHQFK